MRTTTTAAACIALFALTACSGSNDDGTDAAKPPPERASTAPSASTPPASPAAKAAAEPHIGSVQTFKDEADGDIPEVAGTVTVLSYQQPVKSVASASQEAGAKGFVWAALEVKVCSTKGDFITSPQPWTLAYDDGARIEPSSSTYGDFPKPEYTNDAPVSPGDCSRGKIVYPVPGNQRPARAIYTTSTAAAKPLRWTLTQ